MTADAAIELEDEPIDVGYPLNGEVLPVDRVKRWRPLANWLLVIPGYLWWTILNFGAGVVVVLAWFSIVISGRMPQSLGDYLMAVLRYHWRLTSYLFGFIDRHPGYRLTAGYVDPGDSPAAFYSARPTSRRRASVAFRAILVIPQLVVLYFVNLAAFVVLLLGWFIVLITGRWSPGLRAFVIRWMRWTFRVNGYLYLIVDEYPPGHLVGG